MQKQRGCSVAWNKWPKSNARLRKNDTLGQFKINSIPHNMRNIHASHPHGKEFTLPGRSFEIIDCMEHSQTRSRTNWFLRRGVQVPHINRYCRSSCMRRQRIAATHGSGHKERQHYCYNESHSYRGKVVNLDVIYACQLLECALPLWLVSCAQITSPKIS